MLNNINQKTTVAAVKCNTYERKLLRLKIDEAIKLAGGFPDSIKAGAKILIKPNLLTPKHPDTCTTTNPEIVRALVRELKSNGIDDITIGDSPAGNHSWEKLWSKTGMQSVADDENVKLLPFDNFKIASTEGIKRIPVLKELNEFDAVISVPKLKTHLLTKMTGAVKNSYGLVVGNAKSNFHGDFPSPRKMSDFIGRIFGLIKPDFVIMDAVDCMEGDGPNSGKPKHIGVIIAGKDAVAIDACACKVYGYTYSEINVLRKCVELKHGVASKDFINKTGDGWNLIEKAKAKRAKADFLFKIPESLFFIITYFARCRPVLEKKNCIKCGICANTCTQNAIKVSKKKFKLKSSKCVLCMCCIEACPYNAINLRSSSLWRKLCP